MVGDSKDSKAPPPYTAGPDQNSAASSSEPPHAHAHAIQGPTPINSYYPVGAAGSGAHPTVAFLPYYDPRSPHSIDAARRRAWNRFVGAMLWAFAIWVVAGFVTGSIVIDVKRQHYRGRD